MSLFSLSEWCEDHFQGTTLLFSSSFTVQSCCVSSELCIFFGAPWEWECAWIKDGLTVASLKVTVPIRSCHGLWHCGYWLSSLWIKRRLLDRLWTPSNQRGRSGRWTTWLCISPPGPCTLERSTESTSCRPISRCWCPMTRARSTTTKRVILRWSSSPAPSLWPPLTT